MIDYYFSGDYLGMLMFDNFGLQKYSFANLNFQTLWARSSKEWEYICYGHSCYELYVEYVEDVCVENM
jgi:hypothetical protein